MLTKICTKCGVERLLALYNKDKSKKDGIYPSCKMCLRVYRINKGILNVQEVLSKGYKRCTKCKKIRGVVDFSNDSSKTNGLYSSCKDCVRSAQGVERKLRSRGEKYVDGAGYIRIAGEEGRQHRGIIERVLRRKLDRYEYVHHINGDKTDNRLENLEVMSAREHSLLHYPENKNKMKSNHKRIMPCVVCCAEYTTKSGKSKYCSMRCKNSTRKEYNARWRAHEKKITADQLFEKIEKT